jgi:hypothetical protein
MGIGVSGMHYTGMAAMRMCRAGGPEGMVMGGSAGATAVSFLLPLIIGISLVSFLLSITVASAPTEDEIRWNALRAYEQARFATSPELTPAASVRPGAGPAADHAPPADPGALPRPASGSPGPGTPPGPRRATPDRAVRAGAAIAAPTPEAGSRKRSARVHATRTRTPTQVDSLHRGRPEIGRIWLDEQPGST